VARRSTAATSLRKVMGAMGSRVSSWEGDARMCSWRAGGACAEARAWWEPPSITRHACGQRAALCDST